jgi:hypothetical protein
VFPVEVKLKTFDKVVFAGVMTGTFVLVTMSGELIETAVVGEVKPIIIHALPFQRISSTSVKVVPVVIIDQLIPSELVTIL